MQTVQIGTMPTRYSGTPVETAALAGYIKLMRAAEAVTRSGQGASWRQERSQYKRGEPMGKRVT